jgi:hypothetical protein
MMEWCGQSSGIERIGAERRKNEDRSSSRVFIGFGSAPRHAFGRREIDSSEGRRPRRRAGFHARRRG